jgi:integrase
MGRRQFGSVRRLPSGRWQVRYHNGLGERVVAPDTFATKADAQRWLAVAQADILRGTFIDPSAGRITFAEWAEDWLASKPGKRATSLARDRAALRTHLIPALGPLPLSAITPMHVRKAVDEMRGRRLSPKSIRTYIGTLVAIMNAAVDADLIPRSPVRGLHLESAERRSRPTITTRQLYELADEVPPRFRTLILLAGVLGLRWSEAIALRVGDLDFDENRVRIVRTVQEVSGRIKIVDATKSSASRRTMAAPTPPMQELAEHLDAFRPDAASGDLVFVGERGGVLRRSFLARVLKPAATRVGLAVGVRAGLDFHGLRHIATSLMVASGEHPRVMQGRLGHSNPVLTIGLYAHVPDDVDRAAADRLGRLLDDGRLSDEERARIRARGGHDPRDDGPHTTRNPKSQL